MRIQFLRDEMKGLKGGLREMLNLMVEEEGLWRAMEQVLLVAWHSFCSEPVNLTIRWVKLPYFSPFSSSWSGYQRQEKDFHSVIAHLQNQHFREFARKPT